MASSSQFPLSELTTSLMREVFDAITDSSEQQNAAFAEMASEVAMPFATYQERRLGATDEERRSTAESYAREVLWPLLSLPLPRPPAKLPGVIGLNGAGRRQLIDHFRGVSVGGDSTIDQILRPAAAADRWSVELEDLLAFVLAKLAGEAQLSYQKTQALLGAGLNKVVVTGGQIAVKVTLSVAPPPPVPKPAPVVPDFIVLFDEAPSRRTRFPGIQAPLPLPAFEQAQVIQPLRLQARLANESSPAVAKTAEIVGTVKVDFRVEPFPRLEPNG